VIRRFGDSSGIVRKAATDTDEAASGGDHPARLSRVGKQTPNDQRDISSEFRAIFMADLSAHSANTEQSRSWKGALCASFFRLRL